VAATVESVVSVVLELTLVIVLLHPPFPPVPTTITTYISKIISRKLCETCFHTMTVRTFRPKKKRSNRILKNYVTFNLKIYTIHFQRKCTLRLPMPFEKWLIVRQTVASCNLTMDGI